VAQLYALRKGGDGAANCHGFCFECVAEKCWERGRRPQLFAHNPEVLAASGEAASVCDGQAQILVGIDWGVVDANFVVQVGAGAAAA